MSSKGISNLWKLEDWWAVWLGAILLALAFTGLVPAVPKLAEWSGFAMGDAFNGVGVVPMILLLVGLGILFVVANVVMNGSKGWAMAAGFPVIFGLAILSYVLAESEAASSMNLEYVLWAVLVGLIISNTVGTPAWLKPAARTEFYIKTGLVLLGAEILFNRIVEFGVYGLAIAWVVTPIVIVFMWFLGNRVLKVTSKSLIMVIATATSVCGVSAAIAAGAACRAKKDELTLAIGMSLIFTVLMMIVMPPFIKAMGMSELVGGAWMGGTIDSTGAVIAAGESLGKTAGDAAALVKMIQNMLIGVIAFAIAVYWVTKVDSTDGRRPSAAEIWTRLPKFILGFVAASLIVSFVLIPMLGSDGVNSCLKVSKGFRGWLFCMAFVSIGLESNFRELASQVQGGRPLVLYLIGQTFNLVLTLLVAWLALGGVLFPVPELGQ